MMPIWWLLFGWWGGQPFEFQGPLPGQPNQFSALKPRERVIALKKRPRAVALDPRPRAIALER